MSTGPVPIKGAKVLPTSARRPTSNALQHPLSILRGTKRETPDYSDNFDSDDDEMVVRPWETPDADAQNSGRNLNCLKVRLKRPRLDYRDVKGLQVAEVDSEDKATVTEINQGCGGASVEECEIGSIQQPAAGKRSSTRGEVDSGRSDNSRHSRYELRSHNITGDQTSSKVGVDSHSLRIQDESHHSHPARDISTAQEQIEMGCKGNSEKAPGHRRATSAQKEFPSSSKWSKPRRPPEKRLAPTAIDADGERYLIRPGPYLTRNHSRALEDAGICPDEEDKSAAAILMGLRSRKVQKESSQGRIGISRTTGSTATETGRGFVGNIFREGQLRVPFEPPNRAPYVEPPRTPERLTVRRNITPLSGTASSSGLSSAPDSPSAARIDGAPEAANTDQLAVLTSCERRIFPEGTPIEERFPLFYQRYRVPSSLSPELQSKIFGGRTAKDFHPDVFSAASRGRRVLGTFNEPRSPLDLYTPRYIKGQGMTKEGLCPICYESGQIRFYKTKISAFNYHLQNLHGVSASTGEPFFPPVGFRLSHRPQASLKEKTEVLQGKCHVCRKFVDIEGPKLGYVKIPEIYWWKHAQACHKYSSPPKGTGVVFVEDALYLRVTAWMREHSEQV
ncbi:hypothetical protein IE53DRAFT_88621 [Violaceomyces palustris]|uniref:Uncharacterized protein n=1 Tax=Violaceomyces palustris TaxID=1673888 RepID=A0ACD0NXS6_9BASI|nr:hypothetical protein IE53DRAFT_88621 [Violaceomyces palustris]